MFKCFQINIMCYIIMSLFDYPIYKTDAIFGTGLSKMWCPASTDICANITGVLRGFTIPDCSTNSTRTSFIFTDNTEISSSGCCVVESSNNTCEDYIPLSYGIEGKFYDTGIDTADATGIDRRSICHSAPIRKRNLVLTDFITLVIASAIVLVITAIIGACYEFWFKYGDCLDCIYYKDICTNRSKLCVVDYVFPTDLCSYPYQECTKSAGGMQSGGATKTTVVSSYAMYTANGTKCITLDDKIENKNVKPFPYSLIDFANTDIRGELTKMPFRAFALYFLYNVLLCRYIISYFMKYLSRRYQEFVKNDSIKSNFMYLLFTGVLFNIIAQYSGFTWFHGANGYIIYILITIITWSFAASNVITTLILLWIPEYILKTKLSKCNISNSYYKLINTKKLFYSLYEYKTIQPTYKKVLHAFFDIFLLFPTFIAILISICVGLLSGSLAMLYMVLSLLFNIFYIPMSNVVEFLDIIKSHGHLLTILFCISVLIASLSKLNKVTTGVLGSLLAILILYSIIKNIN